MANVNSKSLAQHGIFGARSSDSVHTQALEQLVKNHRVLVTMDKSGKAGNGALIHAAVGPTKEALDKTEALLNPAAKSEAQAVVEDKPTKPAGSR